MTRKSVRVQPGSGILSSRCGKTRAPRRRGPAAGLEHSGNNSYHPTRPSWRLRGTDAHARAGLVGHRSSGGARRAVRFRAGQARGTRSDHLQQIEADHRGGPRPLALDRVDRQGARRDRHVDRRVRRADRCRRRRSATRAVPLLGFAEAGTGGYFDDGGFPVGEGWDEIAFPGGQRRARLCAGSIRPVDAAGLSRRRRDPRFAGGADPPRRSRRGADPRAAK